MELEKRHDVPPPALAVRQVEAAERAFFAGYYAQRRYHPTGWRLRLARDARVLCAAAPHGRLGRVLSVGCGDGEFELLLAARADSVLGVDVSPEAIAMARSAQARAGVDNVEFRCLSVIDLALSERFDTIVCVAFLHHLPAAALPYFLATTYERLAPEGLFYAQDPNVHGLLRAVGRRLLGQRYDTYHSRDERELDPAEIAAALTRAGFSRVAIRFIDLTLIPALYVWLRGPALPLYVCAALDRLWCASPLAPWASGFSVVARKAALAPRP
jgi:2-polyprenyl-3-methyl-5-hydroxy-6-metoxy-1,4-benzoquinol methylase